MTWPERRGDGCAWPNRLARWPAWLTGVMPADPAASAEETRQGTAVTALAGKTVPTLGLGEARRRHDLPADCDLSQFLRSSSLSRLADNINMPGTDKTG